MRRRTTSTMKDSLSTCRNAWVSSLTCPTMSWWVTPSIKRGWWRPSPRLTRRRERGWCLDPPLVLLLVVLLLSTAWCIPHLGVSYTDLNSSSIGTVARNTNSGSSSHNSRGSCNSSTVLPLLYRSRLQLGHCSNFPLATSHVTTAERWDISPTSV
jgi:hypothetical protein